MIVTILKSRLFNFLFTFSVGIIAEIILFNVGILLGVDPTISLLINLGAFFFALTTSPVTWIIKVLGIEIGSNTPNHFQVDKTIEKGKVTIIIRDYSHTHSREEINKILSEQSKSNSTN